MRRSFSWWIVFLAAFAPHLVDASKVQAQAAAPASPAFTADGELRLPSDYREWVYLTTGLGMTYGTPRTAAGEAPLFDNVFVTPTAYRSFLRTGAWPEGTMFILEIRNSVPGASIDTGGHSQGGLRSIEASVKDSARFPEDGWGYFHFPGGGEPAGSTPPLPRTAPCYACHSENTAVENTFVQFYPTLFEVAQRLRTVKTTYDPHRKP